MAMSKKKKRKKKKKLTPALLRAAFESAERTHRYAVLAWHAIGGDHLESESNPDAIKEQIAGLLFCAALRSLVYSPEGMAAKNYSTLASSMFEMAAQRLAATAESTEDDVE